ncbi:hypothetical protein RIF29_40071 [Crotalaria pallida]|uniref:DUF7086 domain-containing protein n=1 Tax=Crotalaria pallida TaxID=3830 RepID=A0AAN9HQC6_CROPI
MNSGENHDPLLNLDLSLSLSQPQPQLQPNQYTLTPPLPKTHLWEPPEPYTPILVPNYQQHAMQKEQEFKLQDQETGPARAVLARRQPVLAMKEGKSETITPPYRWATSTRATVHSLDYLLSHNITSITGTVQCNGGCKEQYEIEFDLKEKFEEVAGFIEENWYNMHDRAPKAWINPVLPTCNRCGQENSLKPVMSTKKKAINWLFLLLGQMIGCCKLQYLKYFCKHTKNHRTGAKDRLVYLTYLGLYKQLKPDE